MMLREDADEHPKLPAAETMHTKAGPAVRGGEIIE